jgi:hypothetical protein
MMRHTPRWRGHISLQRRPHARTNVGENLALDRRRDSGSRNLAMHGTIEITSRSAAEVRGNVDFRVPEYFNDTSIGTVRGPFVANVLDCSTYTGGWPM